ncbi:helix-turn-helix domain-containing protein [Pararhodonellum marinum]|uniref:helix-turn-helix domain-containing protein n=1 Tax=Pararhodonellum marinum TaxID=2755358 RepID=UPI00188F2F3E|nr:helix-turn-helix domain-containing protein [Pararhodonellum marinum]
MSLTEPSDWILQNFKVLFSFLGAIQAFILAAVILFYPRENRVPNILLSIFVFSIGHLLIINRVAEWLNHHYDWLLFSFQLLGLISLYLYIQSLYKDINWKKQWWHIVVIAFDSYRIYIGSQIRLLNLGEDEYYYQFLGTNFEYFSLTAIVFIYIIYLALSLKEYQKYRTIAKKNFSDEMRLGTSWVKQMIYGRYFLIVIDFILLLINYSFKESYSPYHGIANTLAYTVFAYFITIKGKLNPAVYQLRQIENPKVEGVSIKKNDPAETNEILEEISKLFLKSMDHEKLYIQEGLSVKEVAEHIGYPPYLVSQAINTCLEKSFFELINGYRVEEAKKLILDENLNHLSMVGIGFEAGFSSKTAFNTAFKKHTGLTPSEFKRNELERFEQ